MRINNEFARWPGAVETQAGAPAMAAVATAVNRATSQGRGHGASGVDQPVSGPAWGVVAW